jgi:hypothetical protein
LLRAAISAAGLALEAKTFHHAAAVALVRNFPIRSMAALRFS